MRTIAAMLLYFAIVFGTGGILGPVRVLLLEPNIGPVLAVLCEAPFIVAAMIFGALRVPGFVGMQRTGVSLTVMGFGALALLMAADVVVGLAARGMTLTQVFANFSTNEGMIYALLLLAFATMPLHVHRVR